MDLKKLLLGEKPTYPNKPGFEFVYGPEERPPAVKTAIYTLQLVLRYMGTLVGTIVSIAFIGHATSSEMYAMVTGILVVYGLTLIVQPLIGHRLPQLCMGAGAVSAVILSTVGTVGLSAIMGSLLISGLVVAALSLTPILTKIRQSFTPCILGMALFMVVMSALKASFFNLLISPSATSSGYLAAPGQGSWLTLILGLILTFAGIMIVIRAKGFFSTISILVITLIGFVLFGALGYLSYPQLISTPWIVVPAPLSLGLSFDPATTIMMFIAIVVSLPIFDTTTLNSLEQMTGTVVSESQRKRCDFINSLFAAFSGIIGHPGIVMTSTDTITAMLATKVGSRVVYVLTGVSLLVLAFLGKIVAVLSMMPQACAGAIGLVATCLLAGNAIRTWASQPITQREMYIIGFPICIALSAFLAPASFWTILPNNWITSTINLVLQNPLICAVLFAILMEYVILPKPKKAAVSK